jgi:hypothetical protein
MILRVVRVGAVFFAAAFLTVAAWFASGEPRGFTSGMQSVLTGSQDLFMRHNEVRMILHGENPYRLARENLLKQRASEVLGPGHHMDPDYFPSTMLPVLLMAALPFKTVKVVWLFVNLGSLLLLLVCMLRSCMRRDRPSAANQMLVVCLWICGIPVWSGLALGQASIFSLAFTLAAFRADCSGRYWLAGLLLSMGVFKYALVWPLVLFLFILQSRWLCLLIGGGVHLVVHLILCGLMKADPVGIFAEVLGGNAKVFQFNGVPTFWLPFRSWNLVFPEFPLPAQWLGTLFLLSVLTWLAATWLRREKRDDRSLLLWLAVLLLLAVLSVPSRIFAHMYGLPVLLLACSPSLMAVTPRRSARLIACALWLAYVPNGADGLGMPEMVRQSLRIASNLIILALAFDLGRLLAGEERMRRAQDSSLSTFNP